MLHICVILFPDHPLLAQALTLETLRLANEVSDTPLFNCEIRSVTKEPVRAATGALITPDRTDWDEAKSFDLVLVCAGPDPLDAITPGMRAFLNQASRNRTMLGGIGGGALVLAELGFLDDHQAVLPPGPPRSSITPDNGLYCLDRQRLTVAGGMATAEALLAWIAIVATPDLANATAEALARGTTRTNAGQPQMQHSNDPLLQRMTALMQDNTATPLPLPEIAAHFDLSLKQLRLRCQRGLGVSPSEAYQAVRLRKALDLVRNTEMAMSEIAEITGFATLASFSKSFSARFDTAPSRMRAAMPRG